MIPQHSTNLAQTRSISEIGRDRVLSGWYDRAMDTGHLLTIIYLIGLRPVVDNYIGLDRPPTSPSGRVGAWTENCPAGREGYQWPDCL